MRIPNEKIQALEHLLTEGRPYMDFSGVATCLATILSADEIRADVVGYSGKSTVRFVLLTKRSVVFGEAAVDSRVPFGSTVSEIRPAIVVRPISSLRSYELYHAWIWSSDQASLEISPRFRFHFSDGASLELPWGDETRVSPMDAEVDNFMEELLEINTVDWA